MPTNDTTSNDNAHQTTDPRLTAAARRTLGEEYRSVFEQLETRKLLAGDLDLDFSQAVDGTLVDKDGQGTGFTDFQDNETATGYVPSLIDLDPVTGLLSITTNGGGPQGSNFSTDNSHTNLLESRFDATGDGWTVTVRLDGPFGDLDGSYKQSGVMVGGGFDDYAKLVLGRYPEGVRIEFADEYANAAGEPERVYQNLVTVPNATGNDHLDLRLTGNASSGTIAAEFRTPGGNWTSAGQLTVPASKRALFFAADQKAGVIQSSRFAADSYTARYDRFEIDDNKADTDGRPTVTNVNPSNGATNIDRDTGIFASIAPGVSGGRIDGRTLDSSTVRLINVATGQQVASDAQTSGAGDVIVLTPTGSLLEANTTYRFEITDGALDILGNSVVPFTSTFTTGVAGGEVDGSVRFDRVDANAANQQWTGVTFGPDGKLYATTLQGRIYRYDVAADGSISNPHVIETLRIDEQGNRALIGLTFHPDSTASNLVAYATHGDYDGIFDGDADEWTGRITRLSGEDLGDADVIVTGLPRSVGDHLTNQASFGPDGALYVSQAANTAMGAPDPTWSEADGDPRPEQLLTAAILRIDVDAIGTGTVDVQTAGKTNPYDPYGADAPVTIFATGVRNAYNVFWHSNGNLYAPTNGSGSGGNTPAGPGVPGLTNVSEVQDDYLFKITQGGYYGSPNPTQGHFVLNGGNPTAGDDPEQVSDYPVGTQPDAAWDAAGIAYNFGQRVSPNGAIEYRDDATTGSPFGGALDGKIIVTRYSQPADLMILTVGADGSIVDAGDGFAGLEGYRTPLDLVQQPGSGNLFVADLLDRKIYVLSPDAVPGVGSVDTDALYFNDVRGNSVASPTQNVVVTNVGSGPLPLDALITGADADRFALVGSLPSAVLPGESVTVMVAYTADSLDIDEAFLNVGGQSVKLRGLGTAGEGGAAEPSLQRLFDLFELNIDAGDPNPGDNNYPADSSLRGDEVLAPKFTKAGGGDVTVEVLAVMAGLREGRSVNFGTYTSGSPDELRRLLEVYAGNEQRVSPEIVGDTAFDPGDEAFSVYGTFSAFLNRVVYGEETFNTFENNAGERRKVRVFPLPGEDNAYVVTFEEWEQQSDQNDIVLILRNVVPATGATLGLSTSDGVPFPDYLAFNRINVNGLDTRLTNGVHDAATLTLTNTGDAPLVIESIALDTTDWQILSGGVTNPVTLQPGQSRDVRLRFVYDRAGLGNEVIDGNLTIVTNDSTTATRTVQLSGIWQSHSEDAPGRGSQEPNILEIVEALGYQIDIGDVDTTGRVEAVGQETLSFYWERADLNEPVGVRMLAAFHQQFNPDYATRSTATWFPRGNENDRQWGQMLRHFQADGQSLLPRNEQGTGPAAAEWTPSGEFGVWVDGLYSDPAFNSKEFNPGHAMRWYAVRDLDGNVVPDTYLLAHDYTGASFANYDYQDNVYLLTNVRPVSGPSAPSGVAATGGATVSLDWDDNAEGNLAGYHVYRGTGSAAVRITDEPITTSSFVDATAPANATSFYRIVAVDYHGTEGEPSVTVSATRGDADVPAAPSNLAAGGVTTTSVSLAWQDNADNETGYVVQRRLPGGQFQTVATLAAGVTSHVDTGLAEATTYDYRVYVTGSSGNSAFSNTLTVTTAQDNTPPAAPTGLAAVAGPGRVSLTWTDNAGNETGYVVQRRVAGGSWQTVATPAANATGYADTGLAAETAYEYRVRATNAAGDSAWSNQASAITPEADAYVSTDIGNAKPGSTTVIAPGSAYDLVAFGDTIWGTSDGLRLLSQSASGDFDFSFRLAGSQRGAGNTQIGIMARAGLGADAAYFAFIEDGNNYRIYYRDAAGQQTRSHGPRTAPDGSWFRVTREGATFTAYHSQDGQSWTRYESRTIDLPQTLDVGVMVTSKSNDRPTTINARDLSFDGQQQGEAPAAPTDLVGTPDAANDRVSLGWVDRSDDEAGFRVERRQGSGAWVVVTTTAPGATAALDTGLAAGTYEYRVVAFNAFGESVSGTISVTLAAQQQPPAAPSGLAASGSASGIALSWQDNAGDESGLQLQRREVGGTWALLASLPANTIDYLDDAATPGVTYQYRVRAFNAAGDSAWSALASATVPDTPTEFAFTSTNVGSTSSGTTVEVSAGSAYDITARGGGIFGTDDSFRFVHTDLTGDFDVRVRLASYNPGAGNSQIGLMARSGLGNDDQYVAMIDDNEFWRLYVREGDGERGAGRGRVPLNGDRWFRLERVGDTFRGYHSADGQSWTLHDSVTIDAPDTMKVGLSVIPKGTHRPSEASFRDLTINGQGGGGTQQPPTAASGLGATATAVYVDLTWSDNSGDELGFRVERLEGGVWSTLALVAADASDYRDSDVTPGQAYGYRVVAYNAAGDAAPSNAVTVTVPDPQAVSFDKLDIGPTASGTATPVGTGGFDISSRGNTIWGASDDFTFLNTRITGDFDFTFRVDAYTEGAANSQVGAMFRTTLDADSSYVSVLFDGDFNRLYQRQPGETTRAGARLATSGPGHFRLARVGATVTGYASTDGQSWIEVGNATLAGDGYLGVNVVSKSLNRPSVVEVRDLTLDGQSPTDGGGQDQGDGDTQATATASSDAPPVSYSESQNATHDGRVYLIGGFPSTFQPVRDVWRFDGSSWSKLADAPEAVTHAGTAQHDGKLYLVGGYVGKSTGGQTFGSVKVHVFDMTTETWSRGPDLPTHRAAGGAAVVDDVLYYFGGENLGRTSDRTEGWKLDLNNPSATWQPIASLPLARTHLATVVDNGKILAIGGQTGFDHTTVTRGEVQVYDPATNTWQVRGSRMPTSLSHISFSTVRRGRSVFVLGGENAHNDARAQIWRYDLDADTWHTAGLLPQSRASGALNVLDDGSYLLTGGFGSGQIRQSALRVTFS